MDRFPGAAGSARVTVAGQLQPPAGSALGLRALRGQILVPRLVCTLRGR